MRWTQQQVNQYLSKSIRHVAELGEGVSITKESGLHAEIVEYCRARGWVALHGSMAHRTFRTLGEPDFVILVDNGKTVLVECKTATGKLSNEQLGMIAWASKLGHKIHVVRSFQEFIQALNE